MIHDDFAMMSDVWHTALMRVHIAAGFGGFVSGLMAVLLPKFGRRARWHRWIGRTYGTSMAVMAALSIPLAVRLGSTVLLVIGILTLPALVVGWLAIRRRRTMSPAVPDARARLLRLHIILLGSTYIAAWTAFLLNNPIFGVGTMWHVWGYRLGPTIIGTAIIARTARRYRKIIVTPHPA